MFPNDRLPQYEVEWHTSPGIGATYYEGKVKVFAEDDEQASERAQREVHRSFREYPLSHIVTGDVRRISR